MILFIQFVIAQTVVVKKTNELITEQVVNALIYFLIARNRYLGEIIRNKPRGFLSF